MPHRVAVLVLDGVVGFDLGIPGQVFGAATRAEKPADDTRLYEVRTCTADGAAVRSSAGFQVLPDHGPEILAEAHTVVIPGVHGDLRLARGGGTESGGIILTPAEVAAMRRIGAGTRMVSICTGAFVLAAMGLLDGRPATTHWAHAERFRQQFPSVRLDPNVLFVDDGDVLTSAGVAAGIDLCLHIVRRDFGSEVANRSARRCVVACWRNGGQVQFIPRPLVEADELTTGPTREWAATRLSESIDLAAMARQARMSVRTFTRRFRDETGLSPAQWLTRHRVERARLLLETTDLPVDEVARQSGFRTTVSLRQHLHSAVGVAPLTYRRTYRPAPD
jgi:transcriptional regulator GlxA family with amidase domain